MEDSKRKYNKYKTKYLKLKEKARSAKLRLSYEKFIKDFDDAEFFGATYKEHTSEETAHMYQDIVYRKFIIDLAHEDIKNIKDAQHIAELIKSRVIRYDYPGNRSYQ